MHVGTNTPNEFDRRSCGRPLASLALLISLMLAGCGGPTAEVTGTKRQAIERSVSAEYDYRSPLHFDSIWYARGEVTQGMACGQFDAPPEFGGDPHYIRFIYDFENNAPQIEMHRLWHTASSVSQALMEQNRDLFDGIWKDHCKDFHP